MNVTYAEMRKINLIQINILREVRRVCEELGLVYYLVHGSLLGAVRYGGFVPGDDDIDIAMPREMYDVFITRGQEIIDKNLFIQSELSEPEYYASFAKVRDSRTTYIINTTRNLKMNHGIYIDIFPIDNKYPVGFYNMLYNLNNKILSLRLSNYTVDNERFTRKIARIASHMIYPTKRYAQAKRNQMIRSVPKTGYVGLTGGKTKEQSIPSMWFEKYEVNTFEDICVMIPSGYDEYLKCIYDDYTKCTLIENKTDPYGNIVLNACCVDTALPYTVYQD